MSYYNRQVIDMGAIKSKYTVFEEKKDTFSSVIFATFLSSYINTCSDDTVKKIANKIKQGYEVIGQGYDSIQKWWGSYNDNASSMEQSFVNEFASGISESVLSSYVSNLPTLDVHKIKMKGTIQNHIVSVGAIPSIGLLVGNENFRIEESSKIAAWLDELYEDMKKTGAKVVSSISSWTREFFGNIWDKIKDSATKVTDSIRSLFEKTEETISIFDDQLTLYAQYGGDQMVFDDDVDELLKDEQLVAIVRKYYPDATLEEIGLAFVALCNAGCGYVACINDVFQAFSGNEEGFFDIFGFSMYEIVDGKVYFNYNYLIADFYFYCQGVIEKVPEIKYIYDNKWGYPLEIEKKDYVNQWLEENYGLASTTVSPNYAEAGTDYWHELDEILKQLTGIADLYSNPNMALATTFKDGRAIERINELLAEGFTVRVGATGFDLYDYQDVDGNGILDDLILADVGGHAMSFVEVLEDGRIVVSSWGRKYILDINNADKYSIYGFKLD